MEFLINGVPSKLGENLNNFAKIEIVSINYHHFERNVIDSQYVPFIKDWLNNLTNKMEDTGYFLFNGIVIHKKDVIKFKL